MTIKVTSLTFDTLAQAVEAPDPKPLTTISGIPINPLIFPVDWSVDVTLATRWQTDITAAVKTLRPEKLVLASRPVRTQTVRVLGASREESHAILQSCLAHTEQSSVPVPLYCDQTPLQAVQGTVLFGDFSYRRFFVNGRVAIFPGKSTPYRSANDTIFATIKILTPNQMTVEYHPSTTRTPSPFKDVVCPCIDVEMVPDSSGISKKDDLFETTLTWTEIEGGSSLPGLWPPTDSTSSDVLAPFAQIVDGLAIFPFDLNWENGITVDASRIIDSSQSGRSTIQEAKGKTFQRFKISLMGYNRARSWSILRWFDSMQGRAGVFYLIHPHRPWTFLSIPTLDKIRIKPVGDALYIGSYFKKVACIRADKTVVVRKVSSSEDITTAFELTLDSALPDSGFVDFQPIHEVSFEQDEITETWSTDEHIPSIELTLVEQPDRGEVSIPAGIGYQEQEHSFTLIPDCNLLVRAGAGCFDGSGAPSYIWPAQVSLVRSWRDVSPGPTRRFGPPRIPMVFNTVNATGANKPELVRFPQAWQNNGQPAIKDPNFTLESQLDTQIPIKDRSLWADDGWTLLLCFTPEAFGPSAVNRTIVDIDCGGGKTFQFFGDRTGVADADRAAIRSNAGASTAPLTVRLDQIPYPIYVTMRFTKSPQKTWVWVNGQQALAAASTSVSFPDGVTSYIKTNWFDGYYHDNPLSASELSIAFGKSLYANMVVSYKRALSISEINDLHKLVSDIYKAPIETSSLYA